MNDYAQLERDAMDRFKRENPSLRDVPDALLDNNVAYRFLVLRMAVAELGRKIFPQLGGRQ